MYGLKQAGLLANQLLQTRLTPFGYYPARHTPGLWLYKTRPIAFSLIVDEFAVKYVGKPHADHLRNGLLQSYELATDWETHTYSGMSLKWDYRNRTWNISMPGYVSNVLRKFQHTPPSIRNTHPQSMSRPLMGEKLNIQLKMKHLLSWPSNISPYKKSLDPFCTTPEKWAPPCWCHKMTLQRNKQRQLKKPKPPHINCWIIERLTQPPLINYSHSRNPPCAPARTHGQIQAPREPPN
jgi:hypothetical protein